MNPKQQGTVKWFRDDKGYGFIETTDGKDIFLHISQLSEPVNQGDKVEFSTKDGQKGPVATEVQKID